MTPRIALLLAFAAALLAPSGAGAAVEIRDVDAREHPLVRLTVVASDPRAEAPRVFEGKRRMYGVVAENLGRAKSVVLAIDRSRSMAGEPLADAIEGALAFVRSKAPSDRVALVAFGSDAALVTRFSSNGVPTRAALSGLRVAEREGTALYDGLVLAAELLAGEPAGGRIVIVLTDGRDVSSGETLDGALRRLREAGAIVYPVALRGATYAPAPLRAIAKATGGRLTVASSSEELPDAYRAIAAELTRTWRLEYMTPSRSGERSPVRVAFREGASATATLAVPGVASARPAAPPLAARDWLDVLVAGAAAALAVGAAWQIRAYVRTRRLRARIAPARAAAEPVAESRRALHERLRGRASGLFSVTERSVGTLRPFRALQDALDRAAVPLRAVELLYGMLGAALVLAFLAAVSGAGPIVVLGLAAAGGFGPYWLVALRARRRLRAFEDQLPDLLMTLAGSLRAGHTFRQGIQTIVEEGVDPARAEFARVLSEASLGRPVEDALEELAARLGSKDFSFVVSAVAIQRQVGGSLAGILDMVSEAVRERQMFTRRVRAITGQGRLSAYVLIALPFLLAFAMSLINRDYMEPLFDTGTGRSLIGAALVSMAVGSIVLRRIVAVRA